ncbi:hypothetical protein C2W62_25350 [Candidatus Entotheonella serta]|nr:hypothetical protein C2W62_25350 [Candidatus Entotheonella serta]
MDTYALFADATISRVIYGLYDPEDLPVTLIPLAGIHDRQVRHAAENGCFAAYQCLRKLDCIKEGQKFCLSYQFEDDDQFHALGSSAGLAFSLMFVQASIGYASDVKLPGTVAATGVISNGTTTAEVLRVDGITEKLQAALSNLQPGDHVFYPQENHEEIDTQLHTQAAHKGITLHAISTVDQAITELLDTAEHAPFRFQHAWSYRLVLSVVFLLLALVLAILSNVVDLGAWLSPLNADLQREPGCTLTVSNAQTLVRDVQDTLESGRYREAQNKMNRIQHCPEIMIDRLRHLQRDMIEPLQVEMTFHHTGTQTGDGVSVLRSGAGFRLALQTKETSFLYVLHHSPQGTLSRLFPNVQFTPVGNPVEGETEVLLPTPESYFILDNYPGVETIYVVAARWPIRDLEALIAKHHDTSPPSDKLLDEWRQWMRALQQARTMMRGIFYQQYVFRHQD